MTIKNIGQRLMIATLLAVGIVLAPFMQPQASAYGWVNLKSTSGNWTESPGSASSYALPIVAASGVLYRACFSMRYSYSNPGSVVNIMSVTTKAGAVQPNTWLQPSTSTVLRCQNGAYHTAGATYNPRLYNYGKGTLYVSSVVWQRYNK